VQIATLACLACPETGEPLDLDLARAEGQEVVEGFLVARECRRVRLLLGGIAVLPVDLSGHLRAQGSAYRRIPVHDPRIARFVLSSVGGGHDAVPFDLVIAHYRDLVTEPPSGYMCTPHPDDVALAEVLECHDVAGAHTRKGLVVGCGVGRSVFIANARLGLTLGVDSSVAMVRRARNIAVSREHFFLPGPRDLGVRELRVDLSRLARVGSEFAVAHAERLPFRSRVFDVVIVSAADARGPWAEFRRVEEEARRVLKAGGLLVTAVGGGSNPNEAIRWCAEPLR